MVTSYTESPNLFMIQKPRTILAVIFSVALVLRLIGAQSRPIWYDEAFAMLFSSTDPSAMLYGTLTSNGTGAADIHPLGYYFLLWVWMKAFGSSLAVARGLSVLAGVATIAFAYLLTAELFDERTAQTAAILIALSPFHIHYSQEIRMYAFLAFWLILATYAFFRGIRSRKIKWWIIFSVAAAMAQYTHNLAAFYLLPLAASTLLWRDWKNLPATILAGLGSLLLYIPWLAQLPSQVEKISNAYWVERPGAEKFITLILVYITNLPLPNTILLFIGLFLALTVIAVGLMQTFRFKNNKKDAIWLLYLAFMPPVLLFLFSQWLPVYLERALLPSGIIFYLWLAWALMNTKVPSPVQIFVAVCLLVAFGMGFFQHLTYRGFPYGQFPLLNSTIEQKLEKGDLIIHSSKLSYLPAYYFNPSLPQGFILDPPNSNVDTLAPATREILRVRDFETIEEAAGKAGRIWFVIYKTSIEEYTSQGYATHPHLEYLDENFQLKSVVDMDDLKLYLYERTVP